MISWYAVSTTDNFMTVRRLTLLGRSKKSVRLKARNRMCCKMKL